MQKILVSLVIATLATTVAYNATVAYFSDTETSTGNSFTAGTLDLNLDGGNTNVVKFNVTNAKPGDTGGATYTVANVGSLAGYLDFHSVTRVDDDNLCTEPETAAGDTTCGAGEGDLSANMNVDFFVDTNNDTINNDGATIYSGALSSMAADYDYNLALAAAGTKYIRFNWEIPTTVGNIVQSDSTSLAMTFELGQTTGQ